MPDFQRLEKGVGLHSAVFQKPVLQANGLFLVSLAKPAPTAKDRLAITDSDLTRLQHSIGDEGAADYYGLSHGESI